MKIICFGDSLTRGVSYMKGRLRIIKENYPSFLQELFASTTETPISVINKGVFNDDSNLLLQRLDKDVVGEKPDYTIVSIGGNDCNFKWEEVAQNPDQDHAAIVPIDRYLDNVKTLINSIREIGVTPVVLTLPPLDPVRYYRTLSERYGKTISHWIATLGGIEHWHGMYNRSLNELLDQLNVIKIDVRTALKQAGDLANLISDDGIHLTSQGYKELSKAVCNQLLHIMEGQPHHA